MNFKGLIYVIYLMFENLLALLWFKPHYFYNSFVLFYIIPSTQFLKNAPCHGFRADGSHNDMRR